MKNSKMDYKVIVRFKDASDLDEDTIKKEKEEVEEKLIEWIQKVLNMPGKVV